MVMVVKVGEWVNTFVSGFGVCMSTLKQVDGATGYYLPDGDVYAFYAEEVRDVSKSGDKNRPGAGNISTKFPSGKVGVGVQLIKCTISPEVEGTATEELNVLLAFIDSHGIDFGSTRVYFWVKNLADEKWLHLSKDSGGTRTRYMYGYPRGNINWRSEKGNSGVYYFPFVFEEVTIG